MLHYLGIGQRDYFNHIIRIHSRPFWEFQAILKGKCRVTFTDHSEKIDAPTMLVFPPHLAHGWTSKTISPCFVAVFHFDYVPNLLAAYFDKNRILHTKLSKKHTSELYNISAELHDHIQIPTKLSILLFDVMLHRLSLIALKDSQDPLDIFIPKKRNTYVIDRVLTYFREHISEGIGVQQVADAVGYSTSHLRRIFQAELGISVKTALIKEQMTFASNHLFNIRFSLSDIGKMCGFSSASSFSRAFKNYTSVSPTYWKKIYPRENVINSSSFVNINSSQSLKK